MRYSPPRTACARCWRSTPGRRSASRAATASIASRGASARPASSVTASWAGSPRRAVGRGSATRGGRRRGARAPCPAARSSDRAPVALAQETLSCSHSDVRAQSNGVTPVTSHRPHRGDLRWRPHAHREHGQIRCPCGPGTPNASIATCAPHQRRPPAPCRASNSAVSASWRNRAMRAVSDSGDRSNSASSRRSSAACSSRIRPNPTMTGARRGSNRHRARGRRSGRDPARALGSGARL